MSASGPNLGFSTRSIHIRSIPTAVPSTPVAAPIYQTSSFAVGEMDDMDRMLLQGESGHMYSRLSNPTVAALEAAVADLEGTEAGLAFTSGMAAIHAVLTGMLSAGEHAVVPRSVYGGTWALLREVLARFGVETTFVDNRDPVAWRSALRPNTKIVWAETIANPTLEVADIAALAELAHGAGARLVVDATFTTPYLCRPVELGADLVVHSASKYLGGHGDLLGGVLVGPKDLMKRIQHSAVEVGGVMAPFVAWLILRGLKTLGLRMERHTASALSVARALEAHPRVRTVLYPGLPSHPEHVLAQRVLQNGFGGMVSFEVEGGLEAAKAVMNRLQLFLRAGSLGDAHSLALLPAATSHRRLGAEARAAAGIADGLIRLSVGLEDAQDLIHDLEQALS
ncbi:MAG: aminotransferase class I/II-fold pyridoxal phosphate-dependent enzyme [Deltaproteobacteria bacterium]|nr:aminotransferase class I/II-fold pyridoxal phosphate-dependent enzyme [Deltaproteobacteria bacterium]